MGQLARLGVALGQVEHSELYKKGMVFKLVSSMDLVQIFLTFLLLRSAANTVMAKAKHINRLAETSNMVFCASRPVLQSKANQAVVKLRAAFNAAKKRSRVESKGRQRM